jgi:hypothetical protein
MNPFDEIIGLLFTLVVINFGLFVITSSFTLRRC